MRSALWVTVALGFIASPVWSAQSVTNYSWLQLPAADVTGFIGSGTGAPQYGTAYNIAGTGTAHGESADIRWGDFVWIPDGTTTASGAASYWGGVQLDQARNVSKVRVEFWSPNAGGDLVSLKKFYVDQSPDGLTWTNIGSFDYTTFQTSNRVIKDVTVTAGSYQYLRARLEVGDYTYASSSRGGPGIYLVEPYGTDAALPDTKVNWANGPTFAVTTSQNGLDFNNSAAAVTGTLTDDEGSRTGDGGAWETGDYLQFDLKAQRTLSSAFLVWENIYYGTTFDVQYSNSPTGPFTSVTNQSAPTNYADVQYRGATSETFDATTAQYWRILNVGGAISGGNSILSQVEFYSPVPEPAALGLIGCAALGLLRRRNRRA